MKKVIFVFFLLQSISVLAQDAFMRKDLFISGGIGFINYREKKYFQSSDVGFIYPIFVSAEYGISDYISMGPFLGMRRMKFKYLDTLVTNRAGNDIFKSNYWGVGVRGTWHITKWLSGMSKNNSASEDFDFYTSVMLGYDFNTLSKADAFPAIEKKSKPLIGMVVGLRYFLNYRIALFGEVGAGIYGILNAGVTARF